MSIETRVIFERARLPTAAEWADAIVQAGYPLELDREFDPATFSGFLPCVYQGDESGFEYFFGEAADALPGDPSALAERNAAAFFITHSDVTDLATATIAASVLAALTDGVLFDCEGGELVEASSVRRWADTQLQAGPTTEPQAPFQAVTAPGGTPWLAVVVGTSIVLLGAIYLWLAA